VRAGAPDRSLTANAGLAVVSELCDRLGVIAALDAAVGPVKQRDRGFGAGELLTGIAAAQLAGETSDAVKLSSCLGKFFGGDGEGDGFVVFLAGDQAVP